MRTEPELPKDSEHPLAQDASMIGIKIKNASKTKAAELYRKSNIGARKTHQETAACRIMEYWAY